MDLKDPLGLNDVSKHAAGDSCTAFLDVVYKPGSRSLATGSYLGGADGTTLVVLGIKSYLETNIRIS